jgi:hypothetical protein
MPISKENAFFSSLGMIRSGTAPHVRKSLIVSRQLHPVRLYFGKSVAGQRGRQVVNGTLNLADTKTAKEESNMTT